MSNVRDVCLCVQNSSFMVIINCSGGEGSEAVELQHELPESGAKAGADKSVIEIYFSNVCSDNLQLLFGLLKTSTFGSPHVV